MRDRRKRPWRGRGRRWCARQARKRRARRLRRRAQFGASQGHPAAHPRGSEALHRLNGRLRRRSPRTPRTPREIQMNWPPPRGGCRAERGWGSIPCGTRRRRARGRQRTEYSPRRFAPPPSRRGANPRKRRLRSTRGERRRGRPPAHSVWERRAGLPARSVRGGEGRRRPCPYRGSCVARRRRRYWVNLGKTARLWAQDRGSPR